ncbi:MAG: prolyl oligopeptidase family serine peptidase [Myxococcota bacterium]
MAFLIAIAGVSRAGTPYLEPPPEVAAVLNAPELPVVRPSPTGQWLLLSTPVRYPPIADRAAPMAALAGVRVDPRTNGFHTPSVEVGPRLLRVADGKEVPVALPDGARITDTEWSADGERLALVTVTADHLGLWVIDLQGHATEIRDVALSPLLGSAVDWMPDQEHLLIKRVPAGRGPEPSPPAVPDGPLVRSSDGDVASSTYEARDLLQTAHDDARFDHFATSEIAIVDVTSGVTRAVGAPDVFGDVSASPDGQYLLVERMRRPWSHRVAWWRFAHDVEVWRVDGTKVATVAALPTAEQVPIHGVPVGPRDIGWRPTAKATLLWVEALDGGDPQQKVAHRDQVMQQAAPFSRAPSVVMLAAHRVEGISTGERGLAIVEQSEWERRWRHVWTVNLDRGASSAAAWFDLSDNERYADPGSPMFRPLPDGGWVVEQQGDWVYFAGAGGSPAGDRPFVDRRSLRTGRVERLFRSAPDVFESPVAFGDPKHATLLVRRQSPTEVPNVHLLTLGARVAAPPVGEAMFARASRPVTAFEDPTPQIRGITKKIVTYQRKDGVPLSFTLYLPPGYQEGTRLPTVLYAYPREFSDPGTAGQISGSERTFDRLVGPTHLFFLLRGYAVLHNTTMPVLGDPKTAYDTFVEQLVDDAQAAVDQAVALGVTDPARVGVIGHSHGGLMTMTLLAHSDLFRAGIARSGAYNHTIRPFGYQSEMRTLWEADQSYLRMSPVMYAPQIDEPVLIIHGAIDENPGTVPLQSERMFEAIRGTGGTARLVMLPAEGHAYLARESVEHVLAEQLSWFDAHVKDAPAGAAAAGGATPGPGAP